MQSIISIIKFARFVLVITLVVIGALFYFNNQTFTVQLNLSPIIQNVRINASLLVIGSFVAGMVTSVSYFIISRFFKKLSSFKKPSSIAHTKEKIQNTYAELTTEHPSDS